MEIPKEHVEWLQRQLAYHENEATQKDKRIAYCIEQSLIEIATHITTEQYKTWLEKRMKNYNHAIGDDEITKYITFKDIKKQIERT